jgi:hypothetical protein
MPYIFLFYRCKMQYKYVGYRCIKNTSPANASQSKVFRCTLYRARIVRFLIQRMYSVLVILPSLKSTQVEKRIRIGTGPQVSL